MPLPAWARRGGSAPPFLPAPGRPGRQGFPGGTAWCRVPVPAGTSFPAFPYAFLSGAPAPGSFSSSRPGHRPPAGSGQGGITDLKSQEQDDETKDNWTPSYPFPPAGSLAPAGGHEPCPRTRAGLVERLFEMEVPEINDGLITIKKIARIPGERAKIAVESYDDRIDPVGACVGVKGSRIHGIVRELRNENIDVINYTSNIQLFIQRALSPAKISSIVLHEEDKKAEVYLKPEEVSLAIGKGGMNIKLASMLTEYTIDVYRELDENAMDEDIYLDEFKDEIDEWVINAIKGIGLDTAKAVINAPREMLIEKADLEEGTVDDVLRILRAEFEE